MLRRLYDWTMRQAQGPHALPAFAAICFIESSFFPIPPYAFMVPMILARPDRAWLISGIGTVASVLGGAFGYWIGAVFFDAVGARLIEFYHFTEKFNAFKEFYARNGVLTVIGTGLTPMPYKVITISSGVLGMNFWAFMGASLVARSVRFFIVGALLWKFGDPVRDFIERRLTLLFLALLALLAIVVVAVKYWPGGGA